MVRQHQSMTSMLPGDPAKGHRMRITRYILLALVMMFSLTALAGASANETDKTSERAQELKTQLETHREGATQPSSDYTAQASSACWSDPTGDTQNGSTGATEHYPKADLAQWCGTYQNGTVTVSHKNAQATNPKTDPNWVNSYYTGLIWDLDVGGDGSGDYGVYYLNDGSGNIIVEVDRYSDGVTVCSGQGSWDGMYYDATFSASCIGNPAQFWLDAFVIYDSQWDNPDAPLYADIADFFGGPITSGNTTPPPSNDQPQPAPSGDYFTDDDSSPHEANIDFIYEQGLINGCGDGLFCPSEPLTRAQFATIMANYIKSQQH